MAKARALDKRRKTIKNIRKITRTMELIATARFKKAMDRAIAASAYTKRITALVADLAASGARSQRIRCWKAAAKPTVPMLLVLTANRGLCGGYNSNVLRLAIAPLAGTCRASARSAIGSFGQARHLGLSLPRHRAGRAFTHFEDKPTFRRSRRAGQPLSRGLQSPASSIGWTWPTPIRSVSRQSAVVETLLPLAAIGRREAEDEPASARSQYEFLPSAESILEEIVPTSFKVKLFKCFLDAAVSEQIARMVAMKAATENADDMIKQLSMAYNRARQWQITGEFMEIIGGAEALKDKSCAVNCRKVTIRNLTNQHLHHRMSSPCNFNPSNV